MEVINIFQLIYRELFKKLVFRTEKFELITNFNGLRYF